jgi:Tfp pilus assembly protein PilE
MKALLTTAVLLLAGILSLGVYNSYKAYQQRQEDAKAYRALDDITAKLDLCKKPSSPETQPCAGSKEYCEGLRLGTQMSQEIHNGVCEDAAKDARNDWAVKYPKQAAGRGR